jgi:pyruvate formate lyase activating enzyme
MEIRGFEKESYIDFPGKVPSSVIFSGRCNYRCPSCHNRDLLLGKEKFDEREIFNYLDSRKGWIEGVVVSGGEPTLESDLVDFIQKIKSYGFSVKLDTNGSNPNVLTKSKKRGLVDYVAMDIKGPREIYPQLTGKIGYVREDIKKSIETMQSFPDYEFRTTLVPVIRNRSISWMNPEEIEKMAKEVLKLADKNSKWYLQKFVPHKNGLIDSKLERFSETPDKLIQEAYNLLKKYFPNAKIR